MYIFLKQNILLNVIVRFIFIVSELKQKRFKQSGRALVELLKFSLIL